MHSFARYGRAAHDKLDNAAADRVQRFPQSTQCNNPLNQKSALVGEWQTSFPVFYILIVQDCERIFKLENSRQSSA